MMNNTKQTNTNNTEDSNFLDERQDEAQVRNERSCPQSIGSPKPKLIPDGYQLSHADFEEDKNVCEFVWNVTGDINLLKKIS
jgi:hypothetical protein